jgi:phosphatidylserine/phosphatidylglycerophosphate/cardiolipin synthase-like enzyme
VRKLTIWAISGLTFVVFLGYAAMVEGSGPKKKGGEESGSAIDVCFSPGGGCESHIVEEIGKAEKQINVQIYIFTSKSISDALIKAKKRGVKVQVILDSGQEKQTYGRWPVLRRDGVDIRFDGEHEVANNKVIIIDENTVITGSYNFTKAAEEKNAENILIIRDADVAAKYLENYKKHLEHSKKPKG